MITPLWRKDDMFPIIVGKIGPEWITAEAIQALLLQDDAAAPVIARVAAHGGKSREWVAMNMVAWFTAHYTMKNSPWSRDLEREQVKGKYVRYRKIETPTTGSDEIVKLG